MEKIIKKGRLSGAVRIPASKSHSIRALTAASLAEGRSRITNPLFSRDTEACISAWRLLGADLEIEADKISVRGLSGRPKTPENIIDVGNSGTTLYLTMCAAALGDGWVVFTGDEQIRRRPAANLCSALNDLGSFAVSSRGNGSAPLIIRGPIKGGKTSIECPTSQYLSALLLAAPLAGGNTEIEVGLLYERPYVDITLSWLDLLGIRYEREEYSRFIIPGGQRYSAFERELPGDFSSATFFLCAAAITGSELLLSGLDTDDPQGDKAVIGILRQMGCSIETGRKGMRVRGGSLEGGTFDLNAVPDSLPALAVTACFARGETRLINVPQAREKETDRIRVMQEELTKMGADIEELPDGLVIRGRKTGGGDHPGLRGTEVESRDDHRVAMALAVAGLAADGHTTVSGAECASVTFPGFFELLDSVREPC